ncbi:MAG: M48 family metallopeptidase [Verrucomicrobiales bacterium]|nr:M48 family metallopeptidase [Verrucomicrobiales bacterium]
MHWFALISLTLILIRWMTLTGLERLNRGSAKAHAGSVPPAFRETMDEATYARSVAYTLAKGQLTMVELAWSAVVLIAVLFSGVLPWGWLVWTQWAGTGVWASASALFVFVTLLSLTGLPLDWWGQFRLEERFGFNTSTQATWWMDRVKGLILGGAIGIPLLALLLALVDWTGRWWWVWGWGVLVVFQMVMLVVAPVLILPLFNKFQPLAEGPLKDRLLALAGRTGFRARSIEVMDGSRRSRHANAFFTGLGSFRKIVLFDTLMNQLSEAEIESVLAHEIGHFRLRHVPKLMAWSVVSTLAGFACLAWLSGQSWFYAAFGFAVPAMPVAFLLFGLLSEVGTFWLAPLGNILSRKFEYEADAFAATAVGMATPGITGLRKLHEKNLSNLTPHPWYSGFHYSHPTLVERERALRAWEASRGTAA